MVKGAAILALPAGTRFAFRSAYAGLSDERGAAAITRRLQEVDELVRRGSVDNNEPLGRRILPT